MLRPSLALLRSGRAVDPLSRLQLDISAAVTGSPLSPHNPQQAIARSSAALLGAAPVTGDVVLPRELIQIVENCVSDAEDPSMIRQSALDLYAHLRSTSLPALAPPSSWAEAQALRTSYDEPTSLAYLAGLMPSVYGATLYALRAARQALARMEEGKEWKPERVVEFGAGTGSAAFAVREVWPPHEKQGDGQTLIEYTGLEGSKSMVKLGSRVLGALAGSRLPPSPSHNDGAETDINHHVNTSSGINARLVHLTLPAATSTLARLQLSPPSSSSSASSPQKPHLQPRRTLALSSFSLSELSTARQRREWVTALWNTGAEVIVLVERGTPQGAKLVGEGREWLLALGRRERGESAWEQDGGDAGEGRGERERGGAGQSNGAGSWVMAPCPHDGTCPLMKSEKGWCHFSQRVQSPPFLRLTKHTSRGSDDAKFAYVVIRRGLRPSSGSRSHSSPPAIPASTSTALSPSTLPGDSPELELGYGGSPLEWPRMVAAPMKRSGHVILEVCTPEATLQRHTIPKSQSRQSYYDARKSSWGDSFPWAPKNGPQPAPAALAASKEQRKGVDKVSKLKSKKEDRREGRDWERQEQRAKGKPGRDDAVQEFELSIGADGQFKIV